LLTRIPRSSITENKCHIVKNIFIYKRHFPVPFDMQQIMQFNKARCLTFNVWLLNHQETCCGRNLNGPKPLKLQTFRKNYTFSVLCNIETRTKNSLKDNKIFYTYTKEQILQMKIFCDYFVMKHKILSLLYIFWNSKGLTPTFFLKLETCWLFKK
jgi:hypothetical protein